MKPTFKFFDTEEQAKKATEAENKRYPWRKRKAHYTPWTSSPDGLERKFVMFYYY